MQLQPSVGRSGRGTRSEPSLRRGGLRGLLLVAAYAAVFDPMVTWATNAGVHLTPVIMHCTQNTANSWPANRYVTESLRTSHLVEFSRALMTRYESSSAIVMWDLLNEPTPHPGD